MKIFTSYFGNARKLRQADIKMIGIALWKPKFFEGPCYYPAAPLKSMLKQNISRDEYIRRYENDVLAHLKPEDVLKALEFISGGKDIALCCYEKPSDFCHRHLFAKWLTKGTGIEVEEFATKEPKEKDIEQNLFE